MHVCTRAPPHSPYYFAGYLAWQEETAARQTFELVVNQCVDVKAFLSRCTVAAVPVPLHRDAHGISAHRACDGCSRLQRLRDSGAGGSAQAHTIQEQGAIVHQHNVATCRLGCNRRAAAGQGW
jgi:hypothetical protein